MFKTKLKTLLNAARVALTLVGAVIMVDGVVLMSIGKVNFGTVVPFLIGAVFVAHGLFWPVVTRFVAQSKLRKIIWYGLWSGFGVWLISFGVFISSLQQQIKLSAQPIPQVAAVVILGSGTEEGKPTPTLANRLDKAVPIIQAQPQALIITTGGIGFGRSRSEADIMATYLSQAHDIDFKRILQEGKSTSTEENLIYSKAFLSAQGVAITEPIAIVTSDFHTIRAGAIARHRGYTQPITVASPTPLSIRYNSWFREYFAFISGWLLGEY